ncbi:hypothetical protein MMB232_03256 (plasmid) [Brevundimonas subvibrioides]|uniref:hypothetical protein n=1 Tax=Caulobacteraceae TaxID=76892 RepID=UPI0032D5AFA1
MEEKVRTYEYREGLEMFYNGEVLGEAVYSALIASTEDLTIQLKLSYLLQLETETKAWLRRYLLAAGMNVVEPDDIRTMGASLAATMNAMSWKEGMQAIYTIATDDLLPHYRRYADESRLRGRPDEAAVCDHMVEHEEAQAEFARRELDGKDFAYSVEPLTRHSKYPLEALAVTGMG